MLAVIRALIVVAFAATSPFAQAQQPLLTEADVLAISAGLMGTDPWAQPHREEALNAIRDYIAFAGVGFRDSLAFDNLMVAQGTSDHRISDAIIQNYGPHPVLGDYIGTFLVGTFKPGKVAQETVAGVTRFYGGGTVLGVLDIVADGTYLWDIDGGNSGQVAQGRWREMRSDEKFPYEGGSAIMLQRARDGADYTVRIRRQADYQGWLEVGEGQARTSRLYAHRP